MQTNEIDYAQRIEKIQTVWWKKILPVQLPYKLNLRSLKPGYCLDVGCGLGRNLAHLNGNGVGIDHNEYFVKTAKNKGYTVFTPDEFIKSDFAMSYSFDSLLFSHIIEHLDLEEAVEIINQYIKYLKQDGKIIIITPQERGYNSDPSHKLFFDFSKLKMLLSKLDCSVLKEYSFPFPRNIGKLFIYNEFVVVGVQKRQLN